MRTPEEAPESKDDTLVTALDWNDVLSKLTADTDPVRFIFFCVPYHTTITSSNDSTSVSNTILIVLLPTVLTS